MSVYFVSGAGYLRVPFLIGWSRESIPDTLTDRDGRVCRLVTPHRANQVFGSFLNQEDLHFAQQKQLDADRAEWQYRSKRVADSKLTKEKLAPYKTWVDNESERLRLVSAQLHRDRTFLDDKINAFLAIQKIAEEEFWTDEEIVAYHSGRTVTTTAPAPERISGIPPEWLLPENCTCCGGRRRIWSCQQVIREVASRYRKVIDSNTNTREEVFSFISRLAAGPERTHWEAIRTLASSNLSLVVTENERAIANSGPG